MLGRVVAAVKACVGTDAIADEFLLLSGDPLEHRSDNRRLSKGVPRVKKSPESQEDRSAVLSSEFGPSSRISGEPAIDESGEVVLELGSSNSLKLLKRGHEHISGSGG